MKKTGFSLLAIIFMFIASTNIAYGESSEKIRLIDNKKIFQKFKKEKKLFINISTIPNQPVMRILTLSTSASIDMKNRIPQAKNALAETFKGVKKYVPMPIKSVADGKATIIFYVEDGEQYDFEKIKMLKELYKNTPALVTIGGYSDLYERTDGECNFLYLTKIWPLNKDNVIWDLFIFVESLSPCTNERIEDEAERIAQSFKKNFEEILPTHQ